MDDQTEVPVTRLRRLPWSNGDGKPSFLSSGNPDGVMSVLADSTEAHLIDSAESVLTLARTMMENNDSLTAEELRITAERLAECLDDAVKVARMRGERLGAE